MSNRITDKATLASVATTDIIPVVDDPSGTPVTKKATVATLIDSASQTELRDASSATDTTLATEQAVREALNTSANTWISLPAVAAVKDNDEFYATGDVTSTLAAGMAVRYGHVLYPTLTLYAIIHSVGAYDSVNGRTPVRILGTSLTTFGNIGSVYYSPRHDAVRVRTITMGVTEMAGIFVLFPTMTFFRNEYIVNLQAYCANPDTGATKGSLSIWVTGHTSFSVLGAQNLTTTLWSSGPTTVYPNYMAVAAGVVVRGYLSHGSNNDSTNVTAVLTTVVP